MKKRAMTLGEKMRGAIAKEGISLREFAMQIGVSPQKLNGWLHDRFKPQQTTDKIAIINTLKLTAEDFI